jgi:hypothetical protein
MKYTGKSVCTAREGVKGYIPYLTCRSKQASASQIFLLMDSLWLRKITTDPHILPHVNVECPDDRYPKLKICISEMISDRY